MNDKNSGNSEEKHLNYDSNSEMREYNQLNDDNDIQMAERRIQNMIAVHSEDSSDSSVLKLDETVETSENPVFEDSDEE